MAEVAGETTIAKPAGAICESVHSQGAKAADAVTGVTDVACGSVIGLLPAGKQMSSLRRQNQPEKSDEIPLLFRPDESRVSYGDANP